MWLPRSDWLTDVSLEPWMLINAQSRPGQVVLWKWKFWPHRNLREQQVSKQNSLMVSTLVLAWRFLSWPLALAELADQFLNWSNPFPLLSCVLVMAFITATDIRQQWTWKCFSVSLYLSYYQSSYWRECHNIFEWRIKPLTSAKNIWIL